MRMLTIVIVILLLLLDSATARTCKFGGKAEGQQRTLRTSAGDLAPDDQWNESSGCIVRAQGVKSPHLDIHTEISSGCTIYRQIHTHIYIYIIYIYIYVYINVYGWMDGWMGGWMGGWVGGWMDGERGERERYI